ncbi:MAG: MBL fold metallo-hydrolase RNA specificity domain-containing protein, partial [Thermoplasmata archaeon]
LEDAMRNGRIPNSSVYLDGMILEATAIHAAYPEYLNKDLREAIMVRKENPFLSEIFKKVETKEQREEICESTESKIVLATSGMMNGGPVMEYFRAWVENEKHALVFVGYQADGTLGKRIQRGSSEITMNEGGKQTQYKVKMHIETAEGFSGHSTKKQLLSYIATMQPKPRRILVNHGDNGKTADFARTVKQRFGIESYALKNLETIRLF